MVRWGRNTSVDRDRRHLQGCAAPEHGQALRQLVSRQGAAEQARHFLGARRFGYGGGFCSMRVGKAAWSDFTHDLDRKRAISVSPKDVW